MTGKAGQSTRKRAIRERRRARLLFAAVLGLALFGAWFALASAGVPNGGQVAVVAALVIWIVGDWLMRRADRHIDSAKRADRGAETEEEVGRILEGARPHDFFVISDISCPFGNIDHVVIARSGAVFAIETKSTSGRVDAAGQDLLINGMPPPKDYLHQASQEALWVKDKIGEALGRKPYVRAVLLFPNAFVNIRGRIREVEVSTLRYLDRVLTTLPPASVQSGDLWALRAAIGTALTAATGQMPAA